MLVDSRVQVWREGDTHVSHAMPLDVMSCGDTPEQARANLDEAVRLFLAGAQEMGTLEQVLEECGLVNDGVNWRSPDIVMTGRQAVTV